MFKISKGTFLNYINKFINKEINYNTINSNLRFNYDPIWLNGGFVHMIVDTTDIKIKKIATETLNIFGVLKIISIV